MKKEPTQLEKFKRAAQELDCDDSEEHFRTRLGKLVKSDKKNPEKTKPRR